MPGEIPVALTEAFSGDSGKQLQWNAFRRKGKLSAPELDEVISRLASFLQPILTGKGKGQTWRPESGWTTKRS